MADPLSLAISGLALGISSVTAWLTYFRRGSIKMTQPTVIYFGPDATTDKAPPPKIFLRSLLFSTSSRGRIVENMYVSVTRGESRQNFNIWVHGEDRLVRGSGLFVGPTGVVTNHHFLTPKDATGYRFLEGEYKLSVYITILGNRNPIQVFTQVLFVSREHASDLNQQINGLYFDWGPDSSRYLAHIEPRPTSLLPKDLATVLGLLKPDGSEPQTTG